MQKFAEKFYTSSDWRKLSHALKIKSNGKCERCKRVTDYSKLIGHHKIELTERNINNAQVTLNPDNIEIICHECHNAEHNRFGNEYRRCAYVVWGSPLSGKTSFVKEHMKHGDVVIDLDSIWECISGMDRYVKPNSLKAIVFDCHRNLMEAVRNRSGSWDTAWVITSAMDKKEVERICKRVGGSVLEIESTREECLMRCKDRPVEWIGYVEDWWDENEQEGFER